MTPRTLTTKLAFALLICAGVLSAPLTTLGQGNDNFQANRKLQRAKELLAINEEERAVKLLTEIPRVHPNSPVRFEAFMELGKHYEAKNQNSLAIKQFNQVMSSENDVLIAEALYETGKNYYMMNQFNQAFASLRNVTTNYPNSVYANQAYYYIGMCHFKQSSWRKAIDNLRMVGTAVSQEDEATRYAEGGQRFFVKIHDKDLVVLADDGKGVDISIKTVRADGTAGDTEKITLSVLDKQGEYYIGSLLTEPGEPKAGNGILEVTGGDNVHTYYVDSNTGDGEREVQREFETAIVSTASVAITDGRYKSLMQGAFLDAPNYLAVNDLDRDMTNQADVLTAKLTVLYVEKSEDSTNSPRAGFSLDEDEIKVRDILEIRLTETDAETLEAAAHSALFTGRFELTPMDDATTPDLEDEFLHAKKGDTLRVEYDDDKHIEGEDIQTRSYDVRIVDGGIAEVVSNTYQVSEAEMKARTNLLEAKALKELADIFKGVGLHAKSREKGEEGITKLDAVILDRQRISREYLEEAYRVKWETYLVLGDLQNAILTCRRLMLLAPDSTLVDQAMLQIGTANLESGDYEQAIRIFNSVLSLPNSDQKPLAAFSVGQCYERMAEARNQSNYLTQAMRAYQDCADRFPNSLYAGQALEKVAEFYMKINDYARAVQLMENIEIDFPDIRNPKMLLMAAIALYRLKRYQESLDKMEQLVSEFPDTPEAQKAAGFIPAIRAKLPNQEAAAAN